MRDRPLEPRGISLATISVVALLACTPGGHATAQEPAASTGLTSEPGTKRQQDVRAKGADVMPFSLEKTMHYFDKTAEGGIQRVRTRTDAPDQIAMIRAHLHEIATSFASRDFDKPAHIHGNDMPGLAQLQSAKPDELSVDYQELPDGAEIAYRGHTPTVVKAIHRWFDAQLSDHGHDATAGH